MARTRLYPASVDPGFPELSPTPAGWVRVIFGDALELVERPIKLEANSRYKLLTAKRNRGGIALRGELMGREVLTKTQFRVKSGDFVISRRQIIHGACGTVPRDLDDAVVSNEYSALRTKPGLLMDFLRHYSHTPYFQRTCFHSSHGVDVEKMIFKIDEWLKRQVDLPPLTEQRKIAAILSSVDEVIEKTEEVIEQLRIVKRAMMQELLTRGLPGYHTRFKETDIGGVPEPWNVVPLGQVASVFNGRAAGAGGAWLRVFKTKHVYDGMLRLDQPEFARDDSAAKVPSHTYLQSGDTLTPNMAHGTIGRVAYVPTVQDKWATDGQVTVLRTLNHEELDHRFLFEYISSEQGRRRLLDCEKGSIFDKKRGQTHIYPTDIKQIPIAVPPIEEQRRIANILESFDAPLAQNVACIARLSEVKKGLMHQLLTGELRVKPESDSA